METNPTVGFTIPGSFRSGLLADGLEGAMSCARGCQGYPAPFARGELPGVAVHQLASDHPGRWEQYHSFGWLVMVSDG